MAFANLQLNIAHDDVASVHMQLLLYVYLCARLSVACVLCLFLSNDNRPA